MSIKFYRTKDGQADYQFSFEKQSGGSFRSVILNMPSYGSRDMGLRTTHRLTDSNGHYYVCWDRPLKNENEAMRVAARWADLTQTYIKTGKTIDEQVRGGR